MGLLLPEWCRRHPVLLILGHCLAVIIAILMILLFVVSLREKNQAQSVIDGAAGQSGIIFLGHIYMIDVVNKTINISWLIIGCGLGFMVPNWDLYYGSAYCGQLAIPIDVFIDGSTTATVSYSPNNTPKLYGTVPFYLQKLNEFQTTQLLNIEGAFVGSGSRRSIFFDAEYSFPWETYNLATTFVAVNHKNNTVLPILRVAPVDSANDFSPAFLDWPSTIPFNGTAEATSRSMYLFLKRTPLAKAFSVTIFAVNWLLTGLVVFVTVVAFQRSKERMPDALLLLPVTVILIVPSLCALMAGSPAFGILLDTLGLFPQMIIVSLCSFLLLLRISIKKNSGQESNNETAPYAGNATGHSSGE